MSIVGADGASQSVISAQLGELTSVAYTVQTGAYGFQTLLGDGFMPFVSTDLPHVHGLGRVSTHMYPGNPDVIG
jgi:hypothetical protein